MKMSNFIKDIANIKLTKIAKDKKLDYSNIIKEKAKKEDIEIFEKELKKELLIALVKENLSTVEKNALEEIKSFITYDVYTSKELYDSTYVVDQTTYNAIYILYKIFER